MCMYNNSHSPTLSVANHASIDKITLSTTEFDILNSCPISIQPHLFTLSGDSDSHSSPLFKSSSGHYVFGKKAFLNESDFNLDINNDNGASYLRVSFNPNKLFHPYLPCSFEQALDSVEQISGRLQENGVFLDIDRSNIIRLDLMKQRYLSDPLSSHHLVLGSLRAKRQHSRTFIDTYVVGNTQHETAFYDKSNESNLDTPNLIRCEIRAKRKKPVAKIFGIETIKDLMSSNGNELTQRYNSHLYANVFVGASNETELQTQKDILFWSVNKYGQNGVQKFFQLVGIHEALKIFGSLDGIKNVLKEVGLSKRGIERWTKNISTMHRDYLSVLDYSLNDHSRLLSNIYSFAS